MGNQDFRELDRLDWYSYYCHACGYQGWLARDSEQSMEDFSYMAMMILGDPPLCQDCRSEGRGIMNRAARRSLRRRAGR